MPRASSRRTAAQNPVNGPPSPTQTTRSIRSKSGDVNEPTSSNAATARSGRRPAKHASRQDLESVAESSPPPPPSGRSARGRKSSGVVSAMSGTTARTSLTDQDLAEMNSEDMVEYLPELDHISDLVLDQHAPHGISMQSIEKLARDMKDSSTRISKNFKKHQKELKEKKEVYGQGSLINISVALRGIIGVRTVDELSTGLWRPDDILYKANLAATVEDLYVQYSSNPNELPLEKLDREFPEPFLSSLTTTGTSLPPGGSGTLKPTFELGLDIRTQFVVQILKQQSGESDFDPDKILSQVFYESEDETSVRGWDVDGLRGRGLKHSFKKIIADRIEEITAKITSDSEPADVVDFNALNEAFPPQKFMQNFLSWTRLRLNEIGQRIINAGKPGGIQQSIEAEVRRRNAISEGQVQDQASVQLNFERPSDLPTSEASLAQAPPKATNGKPLGLKAMKLLRQKNEAAQAQSSNANTAPRSSLNQAPTAPMFGPSSSSMLPQNGAMPLDPALDPALFGGVGVAQSSQALLAQQLAAAGEAFSQAHPDMMSSALAKNRQDVAEANKENNHPESSAAAQARQQASLLDRQANATRIDWSTQPSSQIVNNDFIGTSLAGDDESEAAFQQDTRPQAAKPPARKRKRAAQGGASGPAPKRVAGAANPPSEDSIMPPSHPYPYQGMGESARFQDYDPGTQAYFEANAKAKNLTKEKKAAKPPQKRKPWSAEETSLLQNLIIELGTSWASIKKHDQAADNVFHTRDQVALKDKARNMKFDLLKARTQLPPNFVLIPLKTSQKEDLRGHGVDVDGMMTNAQAEVGQ